MELNLRGDLSFAVPPDPMSEPCARFFREHLHEQKLLEFFINLTQSEIRNHQEASEAIRKLNRTDPARAEALRQLAKGHLAHLNEFFVHVETLQELYVCRAVDNFMTFLSELLALIFTTRPETLRSNETITVEEALDHAGDQALVEFLAERRVHKMAYQGLSDLCKYFSDKLSCPLFDDAEETRRARLIVEFRNAMVHSRGVVSRITVARAPELNGALGTRLRLKDGEATSAVALLSRTVARLEGRAAQTFRIPQPLSPQKAIDQMFARELQARLEEAGDHSKQGPA